MGLFRSTAVEDEQDEELDHTRMLVAVHESGHVIACDVYGIPVSGIHVSVSRTYWTGQIQYVGYTSTGVKERPTGEQAIEYATMCLAGMEAESIYLMEECGWRKGKARSFAEDHAGTDFHDAQELAGRYGMHAVERRARRLIEDHYNSLMRMAVRL